MSTFRLGLAAAFAFVTLVATFVQVPLPFLAGRIPMADGIQVLWQGPTFAIGLGHWTLQVEAILLAPLLLGVRLGTLSQLIYLAAGLYGWPVFFQGGGMEMLSGPAAGYILAILPACLLTGLVAGRKPSGWLQHWQGALAGLSLILIVGYAVMISRLAIPWQQALSSLVLWPLQGHVLILAGLTLVTALVRRIFVTPRPPRQAP